MNDTIIKILSKVIEPVTAIIIILIASYMFFWPMKIETGGMENTLREDDWVFASRFAASSLEPSTGDIVVCNVAGVKSPLIKRVVAIYGDEIKINAGKIIVNGEEKVEKYSFGSLDGSYETVIKKDHIFMLSDNREATDDSRKYGQIPTGNIKSRILFKFYPFDEITAFLNVYEN